MTMKTLKLSLSVFAIILMAFTSCKKEKNNPADTTVTAEDLLNYQMYWGLIAPDETINLRVLYFTKVGTDVQATLDGITSRVIKIVKVENNTLTLDLNDNGSVVYTFEFEKNKDGIKLDTAKFYNINNPKFEAFGAEMFKTTEFLSVKNKAFRDGNNRIIRFNNDTWLSSSFPNVTGTFYEFGTGGWKGRINGIDYMGLFLNVDGTNLIWVQKFGDKNPQVYQPN